MYVSLTILNLIFKEKETEREREGEEMEWSAVHLINTYYHSKFFLLFVYVFVCLTVLPSSHNNTRTANVATVNVHNIKKKKEKKRKEKKNDKHKA